MVTFVVIKENRASLGLKFSVELGLVKIIDITEKMNLKYSVSTKQVFYEQNEDIFTGLWCFPDICKIKLKALIDRKIPLKIKTKFKHILSMLVDKSVLHLLMNQQIE